MHFKKIEINDFKRIDNLSLEPSKINILLGKNNTCKTSLLEALEIMHDPDVLMHGKNNHYFIRLGTKQAKISGTLENNEKIVEIKKTDSENASLQFKKEIITALKCYCKNKKIGFNNSKEKTVNSIFEDNLDENLIKDLHNQTINVSVNDQDQTYITLTSKIMNRADKIVTDMYKLVNNEEVEVPSSENAFSHSFNDYLLFRSYLQHHNTLHDHTNSKSKKQNAIFLRDPASSEKESTNQKEKTTIEEMADSIENLKKI